VTISPKNVIFHPRFRDRKADSQGEVHAPRPINLSEHLKRIKAGVDAGMSLTDAQHENDAREAERIIRLWAGKLAVNPRRSQSDAALFLCALAGRLNGEIEA
jgi:hypothetical protein